METEPIWNEKSSSTDFKPLDREISVDVAIIGGGITGITTAQILKNRGLNVAVLEARKVGQGTTGQSTGNLYTLTEYTLQELEQKYDSKTASQVVSARKEAMDYIRDNVQKFTIDCDFQSQPMYLFEYESSIDLIKERELADEIGLNIKTLSDSTFPFPYDNGLVLENQAQFNPLTYTQELAKEIHGDHCQIFENTSIIEIDEDEEFVSLKTNNITVKAKYAVHATHTPKGLLVQYHTTLGPYREYGIGVKLKNNNYPEGIFWGHFKDKKYSVRTYGSPLNPFLICVGSMHKVGQAEDNKENIKELENFVRKYFEVESVTHQWGGQNYKSADMLPYIGQKTSGSKEYIATGFSTDGLVYGTLAAKIISDEITGVENDYSAIFKANRHQPIKSGGKFIKETINVVGELVGDSLKKGEDESIADLVPGEGKLLQYNDEKCAVYKDFDGEITVLSPICPHMGCTVHFNNAEKSWDCPCHGSRFETSGKLIEGPSLHGLKPIEQR